MKQQTAVDWFFNQLPEKTQANNEKEYWQAKAIEQQQIKDAVIYGLDEDGHTGDWKISVAQNYYNKTYNK
jgi:6-phosphogluconolactonase/glucosamine-6-phosphate isomerase/deaminase